LASLAQSSISPRFDRILWRHVRIVAGAFPSHRASLKLLLTNRRVHQPERPRLCGPEDPDLIRADLSANVQVGAQLSATAKFCSECAHPAAAAARTGSLASTRFDAPETYTPKHLVEKILTSKAALEGERKLVTVLFADLKSLTGSSVQCPSYRTVEFQVKCGRKIGAFAISIGDDLPKQFRQSAGAHLRH